jgi:hypothetical protein
MKKALEEEKSPLDACLESVLPGVHQWHQANQAAITSLHGDLKSMKTDINDGMRAIAGELQESRNHRSDQEVQLAGLLEMGRQVLLTGKPISNNNNINCMTPQQRPPLTQAHMSSSPMFTPMKSPMDIANLVSQDASEQQEHKTYRMKLKHKSLVDLLSEWIGVGDYEDEYGGIEGRNKKLGASLRKHFVSYTYSRTERTVKGIRTYAEQRDITDFDACRELQEAFEQQRYSVANMVTYFTGIGLLTKRKPRGKVNKTSRDVSLSSVDHPELE